MPMGSVTLRPGVDLERTLADNEAGVSRANLIRYKNKLIQKYGGWQLYYPFPVSTSAARDVHAWQGLNQDKHLAVGSLSALSIITAGSLSNITPQTYTSNHVPNFTVSSNSNVVTVIDSGSSASTFNTVYFNTPVTVGSQLLSGAYRINTVADTTSYTILATAASTIAVTSSGKLPTFTTTANSAAVTVSLPFNGFLSITGLFYPFIAPTSVGGITVQGNYQVSSIIDTTNFTITQNTQASSAGTSTMNASLAQLVYYVTIGPPATAGAYGSGNYGAGQYGFGTPATAGTGTAITATEWTMDNWGETLLACPKGGPIYAWAPDSGFTTAQVITQAPFFNGGIFVSMPQQILVAWNSVQSTGAQDPLVVRWCDAGDYTNWVVSNQTTAGSFHIPTGSIIMGALQAQQQGVIWTDIDVWVMSYVGGDVIFNFNKVGSGCGLLGPHAADQLGGNVMWASPNGFFMLGKDGVMPVPCTVWDFFFQNLSTANQAKTRAAANSAFNEMAWFFPSSGGAGENDSYVKLHVEGDEFEWDYGTLARSAWVDITVLGEPIGVDSASNVYQHETGNDAGAGVAMAPYFESGWWAISDGNDLAFADFVVPDMVWSTWSGSSTSATVLITFFSVDYPGDSQKTYGPYTVTQATEYINTRIRGRLMRVRVESQDVNSFWRIGKIRFRWAPSGRR